MISNNKEIKSEFRIDKLLTKLKVLEGIVKAELLLSDELKWQQAYDKYGLFGSHPPALQDSAPQSLLELADLNNDDNKMNKAAEIAKMRIADEFGESAGDESIVRSG